MRNKILKYVVVVFFAGLIVVEGVYAFLSYNLEQKEKIDISVNAASAIVMEADTGRVLYAKNADRKRQPASTVKVMTAITAIENSDLDQDVIPTRVVNMVEPTVAGLKPGVKYKMKDMLTAILIKSANDAAIAIAEGVAGNEKNFVAMMNRKAVELGLENTSYANASGLPAYPEMSQCSTARDLALIMKYAIRYPVILELMSQPKMVISGDDGKKINLATHNKSLFAKEGVSWGKTGYTRKARRTFVGVDPSPKPRIIIALMGSDDLWNDIAILQRKGIEAYEKRHTRLINKILRWMSNNKFLKRFMLKE